MKLFGLIGFPLTHSFSQNYFAQKFLKENIVECVYENFPIENIDLFPSVIMENPELAGLNVTIPHKELVIPFLDKIEDVAKEVGAVNTIKIIGGKTIGYNTDAYGFMQSIMKILKPIHSSALILGTGGSSKAVAYALKKMGIEYDFVSRNPDGRELRYEDLHEDVLRHYKIIINCTPLGMFPNVDDCPPLNYDFITRSHLLFDLIYNPDETLFLKNGKEKGAIVKNGLEMLELQAERSWEIWNE
ncbi:MAG: shikimate dehydrogenase [Chitinophagales bacterium]|nr:shikimate dehydrogenase [Chitinophagales bacterium]